MIFEIAKYFKSSSTLFHKLIKTKKLFSLKSLQNKINNFFLEFFACDFCGLGNLSKLKRQSLISIFKNNDLKNFHLILI